MDRRAIVPAVLVWAALLSGGCGGPVPPGSVAILNEGHQAYRRGNDRGAIASMNRFSQLHPKAQETGEACYIRGLARCRLGNFSGGRQDFRQAIDLTRRPEVAGRSHLALAQLTEQAGQLKVAEAHYLAAIEALPKRVPPADAALFRLAYLLQYEGRWTEADRRLDRLLYLFGNGRWAPEAGKRIRGRAWTIQTGAFGNP